MTAYTRVQAIGGNIRHLADDNSGNMYILTSGALIPNWTVYKWDRTTLTDISDVTFAANPGSQGIQLEWFKTTLYTCMWDNATTMSVYRWNGGTSWTSMVTAGGLDNNNSFAWLVSDGVTLIWVVYDRITSGLVFKKSTGGAAWADQTLPDAGYTAERVDYCRDISSFVVLGTNGASCKCYQYSAPNWVAISPVLTWFEFLGTAVNYQYFAEVAGVEATALHYSTNWGVAMGHVGINHHTTTESFMLAFTRGAQGILIRPDLTFPNRLYVWNSGTTSWDLDGTLSAGAAQIIGDPCLFGGEFYVLITGGATPGIYKRDVDFPVPAVKAASPSPFERWASMDNSPDDLYLYVACIVSTFPELLRLLADLSAAPTEVFTPGAGTQIGVLAGKQHKEWVWIAGDFGTTTVQNSLDYGTTWIIKGSWVGEFVNAFEVGPETDDQVTCLLDSGIVYYTDDGGLVWVQNSADIGISPGAFDMLDIHFAEAVVGASANEAGVIRTELTENSFDSMHNVTDTLPIDLIVTDVIVG